MPPKKADAAARRRAVRSPGRSRPRGLRAGLAALALAVVVLVTAVGWARTFGAEPDHGTTPVARRGATVVVGGTDEADAPSAPAAVPVPFGSDVRLGEGDDAVASEDLPSVRRRAQAAEATASFLERVLGPGGPEVVTASPSTSSTSSSSSTSSTSPSSSTPPTAPPTTTPAPSTTTTTAPPTTTTTAPPTTTTTTTTTAPSTTSSATTAPSSSTTSGSTTTAASDSGTSTTESAAPS